MVEARSIKKSFGDHEVLRDITFSVEPNSIVGLIGPSGGGKSTLLKIMGLVDAPDEGEFLVDSLDHRRIGLMFQEGALFDSLTVFENVAFPLIDGIPVRSLNNEKRQEIAGRVYEILEKVGLADAGLKVPAQLSGGMRRRASLARALINRPELLLLDDPTCGLDPIASSVIMNLILELHEERKPTTIIVSHDLRRLIPAVDSVLALFHGRIVFHDTLEEIRNQQGTELWNFVDCRFDLDGTEWKGPTDKGAGAQ